MKNNLANHSTNGETHSLTGEEWGTFASLHYERREWQRHGETIGLREQAAQQALVHRLGIQHGAVEIDIQARVVRVQILDGGMGPKVGD